MNSIKGSNFTIGASENNFVLIAGPCAIEDEKTTLKVASHLKEVCKKLNLQLIFKASFDKANRSSVFSERGVGLKKGLNILQTVKNNYNIPVLTDIHESWQAEIVAEVVDIIQIPAFLSRQTDLLVAAARTGKIINVKKAQFMAPTDMSNVVRKLEESNNSNILLTERGTMFGYNNLIVDMRSLLEMRDFGYPVVFDATHSLQRPGQKGETTGGNREYIPYLMKAALAIGVDAIFAEVHPDPENAMSDGPNQIHLNDIEEILIDAIKIDNITKGLKGS